jgi:DNA-binding Lrp family transcriptional regulator
MYFNAREKIILRELSNNSRASLSSMAKKTKCSYVTVGKVIEKLKEKIDLKFTLEIDLIKMGLLQRHILMIKFRDKPDHKWLESLLKEEKEVISAYLTQGQFDLIVFAATSDPIKYVLWEFVLTQKLSSYGVLVKSSDLPYFSFGYLPLDNAVMEESKIDISNDDKLLLRLLNENSRLSYSDLAKRMKSSESTIRYKLFNLVKKGIIKRFTIAVQKPPQLYTIGFFENWTSYTEKFEEKAAIERKITMSIDEQMPVLTTFQMSIPLSGSFGNFTMGLFDTEKDALENTIKKRKDIYRNEGYEERHAKILKPLKGMLPFRNLDIKENYNVVKWEQQHY